MLASHKYDTKEYPTWIITLRLNHSILITEICAYYSYTQQTIILNNNVAVIIFLFKLLKYKNEKDKLNFWRTYKIIPLNLYL